MATKVAELAVDITVTGAAQTNAALGAVEKKGATAAVSLKELTAKAAGAAAAIAGIAAATDKFFTAAEQYNRISARLAVVTTSASAAKDVQEQLFRVAQQTGAEFESLVQTYSRIALSAKDLGATQSQLVQVTANVAKSLQVSGASASEAAAGAQQLAQALGSGKLAGDELKSILENAPVLARNIAEGLGVSVGQLREMGSQGKLLSSDVFAAILKQTQNIDAAFDKMGTSMERSGTRLANSFNAALAAIDNKIGASSALSALFDLVAGSLDQGIGRSIGALISGGQAGLIASIEQSKAAANRRPLVQRAGQLAPVRITADAPKPSTAPRGPGRTASTVDAFSAVSSVSTSRNGAFGVGDQGSISGLVESNIVSQFQPIQDRIDGMGASIGSTFVDSIATGISTAVQSGSIGEGIRALGGTLIGGVGAMLVDFGKKMLLASTYMESLFKSLASAIPGGSITASLGLIAIGSIMVGLGQRAARSSFGGAGRSDGFSGGGFSIPSSVSSSSTFGLPSSVIADGRSPITSSAGSSVTAATPMVVNVFSPDDPTTQRFFRETLRRADARGSF